MNLPPRAHLLVLCFGLLGFLVPLGHLAAAESPPAPSLEGLQPLAPYRIVFVDPHRQGAPPQHELIAIADTEGRLEIEGIDEGGSRSRSRLEIFQQGQRIFQQEIPFPPYEVDDLGHRHPLRISVTASWAPPATDAGPPRLDLVNETVTLATARGTETFPFERLGDQILILGDIALGTEAEVRERLANKAIAPLSLDKRWSEATVPYTLDPELLGSVTEQRIREGIAHVELHTPIRFKPWDGEDDYLTFRYSANPGVSVSNAIGVRGGQQFISMWPTHGVGVVVHEIGHALGLWHEQQRYDRGDFVEVREECSTSPGQYGQVAASHHLALTPYDFTSIMHYSSTSFWDRMACPDQFPMVRIAGDCPPGICTDDDGDGFAERINGQRLGLSPHDRDGLFRTHAVALDHHETGDFMARAMAQGDFDGDGRLDLAFGAPFEAIDDLPAESGAVFLFRNDGSASFSNGVPGLPLPWQVLHQHATGFNPSEDSDLFGFALTSGDFNGDGYDDLAVGAPGETLSQQHAAGSVVLYLGSPGGLTPSRWLTQGTLGIAVELGDQFGFSLAAGDLNGDGYDDLIIGSPGEAPGAEVRSGLVSAFRGGASGISSWFSYSQVSFDTPVLDEQLGFSLAVGDFDGDGFDDLAVGDPQGDVQGVAAGEVFFFRGGSGPPVHWKTRGARSQLQLGYSLAAGDLDGDGYDDLAIGAPGTLDFSGRVRLFRGRPGAPPLFWDVLSQKTLGFNEPGDLFGWALAIGDLDGNPGADLAVGAPGEAPADGEQSGWVFLFRGGNVVTPWRGLGQGGLGLNEEVDSFGEALLIGQIDGEESGELIVGAPGETLSGQIATGIAFLYRSVDGAISPWSGLHQESGSPLAP